LLAKFELAALEKNMIQASMFEAKTRLSQLVKRAQREEKFILTTGRNRTPVAEIVALKSLKERPLGLFYQPGFEIPADFDELPESELRGWNGELE
jgi:antitoxin (DNA-binding transcriptional repressor) of toxin-antitoxin stability system